MVNMTVSGCNSKLRGTFFKAFYPGYPAPQHALQWPDWLSLKGLLLPARECPRSFELHPNEYGIVEKPDSPGFDNCGSLTIFVVVYYRGGNSGLQEPL